jgi:hypothetical protein
MGKLEGGLVTLSKNAKELIGNRINKFRQGLKCQSTKNSQKMLEL